MIISGREMTYSQVRKFVVDFYVLEMADFILYSAMKANTDDIWFQSRESDDWKLLDDNTTRYEVSNPSKYQWQLRFMLNNVMAGGASIINSMHSESALVRNYTVLTHGLYYRLMKQDASL